MNEFESEWISLSQRFVQNGWIQDGRIQDGCHHQVNQIELVWVKSQSGGRVFWSESERRKPGVWIQHSRIQDGCHHQGESEWMSEGFFIQMVGTNLGKCEWVLQEKLRWLNSRWPNSRWQNSRWLPSSSWVRMNKFESDWISLSQSFVQNCWIQDGRIQDGCHHQVNQIELVWVRVRVKGECFWVNLRDDKKVSESKMAVSESNMVEFKMAPIIKLSQNEWVKVFFVQMVGTNLGKCEWVWEGKLRWLNPKWWNSRWLPSSSLVRMNKFESDWISLSQIQCGVRVVLSESERR